MPMHNIPKKDLMDEFITAPLFFHAAEACTLQAKKTTAPFSLLALFFSLRNEMLKFCVGLLHTY